MHLIGGDGHREDHAFLVVVLLDGRRQQPPDSNAVAAHVDGLLPPVLVQEQSSQGLAEEGAQLEYVPYLNAPGGFQHVATVGAQMPGLGQDYVGEQIDRKVSGIVGVYQMGVGLVGAHHEVAALGDGRVGDSLDTLDPNRRGRACHQPGGFDLIVGGQTQLVGL